MCAYASAVPLPSGSVFDLKTPLLSLPPGAVMLCIDDVAVAVPYRGRGLLVALVAELLDLARERGSGTSELVSVQVLVLFLGQSGFETASDFEHALGTPADEDAQEELTAICGARRRRPLRAEGWTGSAAACRLPGRLGARGSSSRSSASARIEERRLHGGVALVAPHRPRLASLS